MNLQLLNTYYYIHFYLPKEWMYHITWLKHTGTQGVFLSKQIVFVELELQVGHAMCGQGINQGPGPLKEQQVPVITVLSLQHLWGSFLD